MDSMLVGYVRKSRNGGALKVNISTEAFDKAQRYLSQDGEEFVGLVMNLNKIERIIEGTHEVTNISQLID